MSSPSLLHPLTEQSCSTTSFSLAASRQCSLEMSRGNAVESSSTSHSPLSLPIEMAWLSVRSIAAGRSARGCPFASTRLQLVGMATAFSYGAPARAHLLATARKNARRSRGALKSYPIPQGKIVCQLTDRERENTQAIGLRD